MDTKIVKIKINELMWSELGIINTIDVLTRDGESMQLRDLYELTADSKEETTKVLLSLSRKQILPELEINPKDELIKDMTIKSFTEANNVPQN